MSKSSSGQSNSLDRRSVLLGGLAGLAWTGLNPSLSSAHAADKVPVIDTHLHCFAGRDSKTFPYHEHAPYHPEGAATPEQLLKCMDEAGVDHAIVVHPEPYQDDHRYLEHCLAVGKGRLKGTCLVFADQPNSAKQLPELAKKLAVVAVRVHAYAPERLPPFGKPELKALWKEAGKLGLAIQLHLEPRYAPEFEPLIEGNDDVRVIVDHLGRPFQGTPKEHEVIVRWSRFKNTVMKVSSIPDKETYPYRDITPVIKQLADAYGPERLIYGGGFSSGATGESYRKARERTAAYLSFLKAADLAKVLGGNAAQFFRFGA
jgi:predicted TIM-barrel fold metal-dependent hydrolase